MPVDVEGVMLVAEREDVPLHRVADARVQDRRVADEGAAVDRLEADRRLEQRHELAIGAGRHAGEGDNVHDDIEPIIGRLSTTS